LETRLVSVTRKARKRRGAGTGAVVPASVKRRLAQLFERNGYARWQNPSRMEEMGYQLYKKGDEVRLVASSAAELEVIRGLVLLLRDYRNRWG
jgi:hypothetical protein